jgi:hypothetical protein
MFSLENAQANFIATINDGPDALDQNLFNGPVDRVLLGLKAHANTISHARLVALEESFPLTRETLGEERFNQLSREYTETAVARACDNNSIGKYFGAFLSRVGAELTMIDLAAIEWAWLESYHAADTRALTVADLAGLEEAELLEMQIARHPSARLVAIHAPLPSQLEELACQQPAAILCIRPEAEVRLIALDQLQSDLLELASGKKCTLGNLLAHTLEQAGEQAPLEPILNLIGAGALVKADSL